IRGSYSAASTAVGVGEYGAADVTVSGLLQSLGDLSLGSLSSLLDLTAATLAPGSTDLPSLTISNGTLRAVGDWTVSGPVSVSYGRLDAGGGTGRLMAAGGADLSDLTLSGYTLVIPPGQSATMEDYLNSLDNGSVLDNQGTFTLNGTGRYGNGD